MPLKIRACEFLALFGCGLAATAILMSPVLAGRIVSHLLGAIIAFSLGVYLFAFAIRPRLARSTRLVLIGGAAILALMGAAELIARPAERMKMAETATSTNADGIARFPITASPPAWQA